MAAAQGLAGVGPETPLVTFLRMLILRRLDRMMAHFPGTLAGDIEELHNMRVDSRRLRSALLLGRDLFPARRRYRRFERRITRFTRALGHVRDLDVMLLYLEGERAAASPAEIPHLDRLAAHIDGRRAERREAMNEALHVLGSPEKLKRMASMFEDSASMERPV